MKKKKLLIASDAFLPHWDGVARFLSELIPRIKEDYEITVLAPKFKGKKPDIEGIKIIQLPLLKIQFGDTYFSKFKFKKIKKIVANQDIVFNQTIGPIGIAAIRAAKKLKKPIISYIHIIEWELAPKSLKRFKLLSRIFAKWLAKRMYNKCSLLLVPSMEVTGVLNRAGIKTLKSVVHLGTDTLKFYPAEDKISAKEKLDINQKNTVIGYCGRISREKDLMTLYRAFVQIHRDYPNTRLLIIGAGIEEHTDMFKNKKGIIMKGSSDNVVPYLQATDIFVMPSLIETTSLATMEAMSCGLAVLSTKVGLTKEYIKNKVNGIFFPKRNSYVLRKKIEQLIKDRELRFRLGKNARRTIEEKFSWERTVKEIKKVLGAF
ncbi:glycosyltransferase family 4 protein [Candidatus Woesearchaeota archaeon]|nr:glycosyltransferase family 4 protein [Candidatus Woesearchaeota archaeon]